MPSGRAKDLNWHNVYIYRKCVSSVGSVGSICKDDCFIKFYFQKVNQQQAVLNQQTGFSCWFIDHAAFHSSNVAKARQSIRGL